MIDTLTPDLRTGVDEAQTSAVSWASIVAGGIAAAALTLLLLAFGPAWACRRFRPGQILELR